MTNTKFLKQNKLNKYEIEGWEQRFKRNGRQAEAGPASTPQAVQQLLEQLHGALAGGWLLSALLGVFLLAL